MSPSETDRIGRAVRRAFENAGLEWPPSSDGPIPLDRLISDFELEHEELPGLTRSRAAETLARYGIDCSGIRPDATPLAGFICANDVCGTVFVSSNDPLTRRRFSAAHELGHFLLHFQPTETDGPFVMQDTAATIADPQEDDDWLDLSLIEREANRFAAELLMPEPVVRQLCDEFARRQRTTPRFLEHHVAGELLVSRQAARWRLRELDLI